VKLYETTGNARWLSKIVTHFNRMVANMQDHFGDGWGTWVTRTYSAGLGRTGGFHNRGTARISPAEERIRTNRGGEAIEDREWIVEVQPRRQYRVFEYGTRKAVAKGSYRSGAPINFFSPLNVVIEGKPEPGDRFWVQTFGGEPQEHMVHQGLFLHPVSRFIEHALKDRKLKARYGKAARRYLDLIGKIVDKHERDWVDMTRTAGAYRFPPLKTDRCPNRTLPHNQYLAIGRAYLHIQSVSRKRLFLDRAERMARNFKRNLRKTGQAYTWHYWDWIENGEPGHSAVEAASPAHIDIGFAVDACRKGVVFTNSDLKRFAHTLLEQMWNGSLEDPKIGGRVDAQEPEFVPRQGDSRLGEDWIDLCQWRPEVWDVLWALFCKEGCPVAAIPSILQGWTRLQEGQGR
jgi:hypothetical protein